MARPKLLITGASGLIGGVLCNALSDRYEITALNRSDVPGVRTIRADIADATSIVEAFQTQDYVVHLAAKSALEYTWDEILYPNVIGTYNVFKAAVTAGVSRVLFASSGSITVGWEQEEPYRSIVRGQYDDVPPSWPMITHEKPPRPYGLYGCSKLWGEGLARHFSDTTRTSFVCLRIGEVVPENKPTNTRRFSMWCSHRDLIQMVERCLAAPDSLRFDTFYVVSDNKWNYRGINHAREIVGYAPQDNAEDHRESGTNQ